ncbi:hypothetical protein [Kribbella speibonae]|uniref:Bacterial spore germination immunoglobulin-like domain-containing protein n=1 Tax=Kribbella speibonae TaxID=1572660 RepID=A0ABY2A721_9ACTN|nr:hypothetical protein [Kribbella speibonae]TCC24763.1 hypothetical protein E0H58_11145 [Kribbella speibonae]
MTEIGPGRAPDHLVRDVRARLAIAIACLAIIALAVTMVVLVNDSGEPSGSPQAPGPTVTQTGPTVTVTATPKPSQTTSTPAHRTFRYQPLWPFTSEEAAAAWQQAYRSGGTQPWHLDPAQTALSFTTGFLDFEEIDLVVAKSVRADEAYVSVGYRAEGNRPSVAAVVHLARLGQGDDAPWEVVGTRDSSLTLTQPRYGAAARSPLTVGGRITGVDEAIRVDVRQASTGARLGTVGGVPAGGQAQPWSTQVTFQGATDPVLVVVAATGGHYQGVEAFAVTAIRTVD